MTALPSPFDTLADEDQATLATYLTPEHFEAGTVIVEEGDPGDRCYLIEEGRVRVELPHEHVDTDAVLEVMEPGTILGELSLLDRQPRSARAVADTEVRTRVLTADALEQIGSEHPHLGLVLMQALARDAARKLRQVTTRLATHVIPEAPDARVDAMVARAVAAQRAFQSWDEPRVDALLRDLAGAVAQQAEALAAATVEETRLGDAADKATKIRMASLGVYASLQHEVGHGLVREIADRQVAEIAGPTGVVFGLVPVTNPVPTAIFKTLIALKGRNAVLLSFHRGALGVGSRLGEILEGVLAAHGAPDGLVQWLRERGSRKVTAQFMAHPDVSLVLATGGAGMVRAAYSSGTPALGVGPGNAPTWITASADLDAAAHAVVASKSFDCGLICGAEHNLVVDSSVRDAFEEALERAGAAVLTGEEAARFMAGAVDPRTGAFRLEATGQPAARIAAMLGIERAHPIRLLVVPASRDDLDGPLGREKMTPILSVFTVDEEADALALCETLLTQDGTGHTAIVHTTDPAQAERFAMAMPASRVLVNSPGSQGVVGLTTGLDPSFTLGCGTYGGNSTTDNVTYRHLLNLKRMAHYREGQAEATMEALHAV